MTINWTDLFEHVLKPPETVGEAVDRLMEILGGEEKLLIALMQEDDLIYLHFGLGLAIDNAFGLHEPGSKLLASCGTSSQHEAYEVIILNLWRRLRDEDL